MVSKVGEKTYRIMGPKRKMRRHPAVQKNKLTTAEHREISNKLERKKENISVKVKSNQKEEGKKIDSNEEESFLRIIIGSKEGQKLLEMSNK
jgi:hypothetical protein